MKIELLWFEGCPNHEPAGELLKQVLTEQGIQDEIVSVEVTDYESAQRTKFVGSPTIRINGQDVDPTFKDTGDYSLRCRVFMTDEGFKGRPQKDWIEKAVKQAVNV